jgi:hypothetical protein
MEDSFRFALTMLIAPAMAFGVWLVAKKLGRFIVDKIPAGQVKDMLTKQRDYGGY